MILCQYLSVLCNLNQHLFPKTAIFWRLQILLWYLHLVLFNISVYPLKVALLAKYFEYEFPAPDVSLTPDDIANIRIIWLWNATKFTLFPTTTWSPHSAQLRHGRSFCRLFPAPANPMNAISREILCSKWGRYCTFAMILSNSMETGCGGECHFYRFFINWM